MTENTTPNWKPPVLETQRLILRPIELSDAAAIFHYAQNPDVCRYLPWETHQSIEDSRKYILERAFKHYHEEIPEPWGICLRENTHQVIGSVGCFWRHKEGRIMELGYALSKDFWGKGIMVEAAIAAMEWCQQTHQLKRIEARTVNENRQSLRVMEKCGLVYEGTHRAALFSKGKHWDMIVCGRVFHNS